MSAYVHERKMFREAIPRFNHELCGFMRKKELIIELWTK